MAYTIHGGDHGNYQILDGGTKVAFVRRNETGGGYTVRTADDSKSVQMRSMPKAETSDEQAAKIMKLLT